MSRAAPSAGSTFGAQLVVERKWVGAGNGGMDTDADEQVQEAGPEAGEEPNGG